MKRFFETIGNGEYIKTANGNYLVFASIEKCEKGIDPMFVDPQGKEIRGASLNEWWNAFDYWDGEKGNFDENYPFEFIDVFEIEVSIETERIGEYFDSFKPETGSNGGDYGFWENKHTISFENKSFSWETAHTTADFDYDEITASFQKVQSLPVAVKKEGKILVLKDTYIRTQEQNIKGDYFFIND